MAVQLIIFSKDRPWQLLCHLSSFFDGCTRSHNSALIAGITVVYASSSAEQSAQYDVVFSTVPSLSLTPFTAVNDAGNFRNAVLSTLQATSATHVLFSVDDAVWLDVSHLQHAVDIISHDDRILGYLFKLHPGISYSHPADMVSWPPLLLERDFHKADAGRVSSMVWAFAPDGRPLQGDWGYPLCLSSGLYRTPDLLSLLRDIGAWEIEGSHVPWSHPNTLETAMNVAWARGAGAGLSHSPLYTRPLLACTGVCPFQPSCGPALLIPTWAAVQAGTRRNRVYSVGEGEEGGAALSYLTTMRPRAYAVPSYRAHPWQWQSVHVGAVWTEGGGGGGGGGGAELLSFLMPIHNGASTLRRALDSMTLAAREYGRRVDGCIEVVLVDDGSTDGTAGLAREWSSEASAGCHAAFSRAVVVTLPARAGVAAALNCGWAFCSGALIARMDADDECSADRLVQQASFLRSNPACAAVGCSVRRVQDGVCEGERGRGGTVLTLPLHPCLVRWGAWFASPLAHPGTTLRARHERWTARATVHGVGGMGLGVQYIGGIATPTVPGPAWGPYPLDAPVAEDYGLWMEGMHPPGSPGSGGCVLANIGGVCLTSHKTGRNESQVRAAEQSISVLNIRVAAVRRALEARRAHSAEEVAELTQPAVVAIATGTDTDLTHADRPCAAAAIRLLYALRDEACEHASGYADACRAAGRVNIRAPGYPPCPQSHDPLPLGHGLSLNSIMRAIRDDAKGRCGAVAAACLANGGPEGAALYADYMQGKLDTSRTPDSPHVGVQPRSSKRAVQAQPRPEFPAALLASFFT